MVLVAISIISCKLFNQENCEDVKPFDYLLGDVFEIKADSSIVLKDSINNKYYTIWFSGPVEDNRVPLQDCDPNNSDGPKLKSASIILNLVNEVEDTSRIELEMVGCVQGASKEQVIKFENDSLVFTIEHLLPYPKSYDDSIKFENYILAINLDKELQNHILVGSYSGKRNLLDKTTWIAFDIVFEDSTYNSHYPDTLGSCCYGEYKRTKEYLLFTNHCMYLFDGIDEWRQIWALRGLYKYEFDGNTLRFWNEDGWTYNLGIEYIFTKNKIH